MCSRFLRGTLGLSVGLAFLLAANLGAAQTTTNVQALQRYAEMAAARAKRDKADAVRLAHLLGIPVRQTTADGRHRELMRFIGSVPIYYETMNLGAAETVGADKLWPGGISGYNLSGSGVQLAEWDEGSALTTHQELTGRAFNMDSVPSAEHSTHVAGTLIATGVDPLAHGMSFQGTLHSYPWDNDSAEMASEAAAGLVASNHSYGIDMWAGYEDYAIDRDTIAYNAPKYLICQAAGNDGDYGYGTIIIPAYAKDIVTVGAVYKNPSGYTGPGSVTIADFSSRGPAEDGRIKPDICAPGVDLYSCYNASNTAYETMSGTSMATPTTCGNVGLITQYWRSTHSGVDMRSATMKGLLIHTADECGPADGPDYNFGWGQLDSYSACLVINESLSNPDEIQELVLNQGDTYTLTFGADGNLPVRATICWTDPPGPNLGTSTTPVLVDDLDLRVANNGTTYEPWVLDPNNPDNPATTGDNIVDNVEQVVFQPTPGTCTLTVGHKGTLQGGSQAFSLILTGATSASLTGLSATPTSIGSGQTAVGTVTMNLPASSGGANVKISSSNKLAVKVPAYAKVPPQQTSGSFSILAKSVMVPTPVTITAKYGAATFTVDMTINPSWLIGLTLNPTSVTGGNTSTGTATLGETAGPGGALVTLSSSNTSVATVNWKLLIPEGQTSANFTISTFPVSSTQTVNIQAAYPGPTLTAPLTVVPSVGVSSVTLSPSVVPGGNPSTGTVTLMQNAPNGGAVVQLGSDNSVASVPGTVVVAAGKKTATFQVSTAAVTQQTIANISATYQGGTKSAALTVNPAPGVPLKLVLNPTTVKGGGSVVGTLSLSGPAPAGGLTIRLASSNTSYATVPKSVVIPAGLYSTTFTVQTKAVSATKTVTISATAPGKSASATLQITH